MKKYETGWKIKPQKEIYNPFMTMCRDYFWQCWNGVCFKICFIHFAFIHFYLKVYSQILTFIKKTTLNKIQEITKFICIFNKLWLVRNVVVLTLDSIMNQIQAYWMKMEPNRKSILFSLQYLCLIKTWFNCYISFLKYWFLLPIVFATIL